MESFSELTLKVQDVTGFLKANDSLIINLKICDMQGDNLQHTFNVNDWYHGKIGDTLF